MSVTIEKIRINDEEDEEITLLINDKEIGYANYDQHGWAGINLVRSMAERISKLTGVHLDRG